MAAQQDQRCEPHGVPEPPRAVPVGCTWPRVPHRGEMPEFHLLGKNLSSADIASQPLWKSVFLNAQSSRIWSCQGASPGFLFLHVKIKQICIHSGDPGAGGAAEAAVRSGARSRQVAPCCSPGSPQRGAGPSSGQVASSCPGGAVTMLKRCRRALAACCSCACYLKALLLPHHHQRGCFLRRALPRLQH